MHVDSNKYSQVVLLVVLDKYAALPNLENCFTNQFADRITVNLHRSMF